MSELFERLKKYTMTDIKLKRLQSGVGHEVCQGCRLPYPDDDNEEKELKPFPICDDCLEALKPIYKKRGELK